MDFLENYQIYFAYTWQSNGYIKLRQSGLFSEE